MKAERHAKILELIKHESIETQEELTEKLKQHGFEATQATVSRDIKELRLIKVSSGGKGKSENKYKYSVNNSRNEIDSRLTTKFKSILNEAIMKIDYAGNLVVLKTYSGMAQAAGAAIDAIDTPDIIGSVAGDDTLLIVMRSEAEAQDFTKKLSKSVRTL
jgi:arginine repressor